MTVYQVAEAPVKRGTWPSHAAIKFHELRPAIVQAGADKVYMQIQYLNTELVTDLARAQQATKVKPMELVALQTLNFRALRYPPTLFGYKQDH